VPNAFGSNVCSVASPKLHRVFQLYEITCLDCPIVHAYTNLQRIYKPQVTVRMEYQILTLIGICRFKLTHLILIGQQLPCFYCQTCLSHSESECLSLRGGE